MTRRQYRRRWLQLHKRYEAIGLRMFRKGIKQSLANIPFDNIQEWNYKLSFQINVGDLTETYLDFYERVGVIHGKKVGKEINKEIEKKRFEVDDFSEGYRRFIQQWLLNNGGIRITSVREELIEYLIKFIVDQIDEGKDIRTISRLLQKHILSRGFYRWQIERIVRTETTAAANQGAIRAGESSNIVWEKEWISSKDARTRRRPDDVFDHFDIDGLRVPKGQKFNIQGDLLDYPGDPNGQPANVINCRCTVAVVPKRDESGRIIFNNPSLSILANQ
nr:phage minor head protein [uncultured Allomuricauda sp.]